MKCIIPCAGYASRLGEFGQQTPKSLIKIKDRFLIDYIIDCVLEIKEVDGIFVISNAKFYDQFNDWLKGFSCKVKVNLINDGTTASENRLGTMNDIKLALDTFEDDFLVIFGDSYFNFNLAESYRFFKSKNAPVMVLSDIGLENAKRSAPVVFDNDYQISSIVEKPKNPTSSKCSAGVYFLAKHNKQDFYQYLKEGKNPDGIVFFYEDIIPKGIFAYEFDKEKYFYIDIGIPEAVEAANKLDPLSIFRVPLQNK